MKKQKSVIHPIRDQKGQGLVEYLIIVAVVAVGALSIMRVVGQSINIKFTEVAKALGATVDGDHGEAKAGKESYGKKDLQNFMQGAK